MKMFILEFSHPSQIAFSLAITFCSGLLQRQSEHLALRTYKEEKRETCSACAWLGLNISFSYFPTTVCPSVYECSWDRRDIFSAGYRWEDEKGQEAEAVSTILIPACYHIQLFLQEKWQRKCFLLRLMSLQVTAVWLQ